MWMNLPSPLVHDSLRKPYGEVDLVHKAQLPMDSKVTSALEKSLQDKAKGNYQRALRRLTDALGKFPDEVELYLEAADVCLEGGESLQATQYLKKAQVRFRKEKDRLDSFAIEKLAKLHDPVLGKFLVELFIKRRELTAAAEVLEELQDRAIRELLQRTRTKKQTLNSAARGGNTLKSEIMINSMSEALLCLRLGRMKESVRSFLEILDEKPVENEVLEPFFAVLEKKHPKAGRIRFAYACSLIASQQYDKAMSRLVQSVQMEPKVAEDALARLRDLTDTFETPPDSLQDALVEILLVKGDVLRAGEILQESLTNNPENARMVLELMRPYVEEVSDSLVLHYLYMDAALLAEQTRRVLEMLKKICKDESHRDDVYQWLENKSTEVFLPTDVMMYHGEMAIDTGDVGRAIEIFRAIAGSAPAEIPSMLRIVEKHKDADQRLVDFREEHIAEQQQSVAHTSDGADFEHFENKEFSFSSASARQSIDEQTVESAAEGEPAERAIEPEDPTPGPFAGERNILDESGKKPSPLEEGLELAAKEAIREHDGDIVWEEEDAEGTIAPPQDAADDGENDSWLETQSATIMGDSSESESAVRDDDAHPDQTAERLQLEPSAEPEVHEEIVDPVADEESEPPAEPAAPQYEIDEEQVTNLADAVRHAGAKLFFHVDDQSDTKVGAEADSAVEEVDEDPAANAVSDEPAATEDEITEPEDETPETEEATEDEIAEPEDETPETEEAIEDEYPADDLAHEEPVLEATPVALPPVEPVADDVENPNGAAADTENTDGFRAKFEEFLDGRLYNGSALALASEAIERGLPDEARELLRFKPNNEDEALERKRRLVDYYLSIDRPIPALGIIETIRVSALENDDKRDLLIKKAACQKLISDLEGAHNTYLRIMREFPSPEIDRMAKRNYERYLQNQCGGALVLEKTASLNDE